jgi:4-amino-4-deoxy-L-arabinose transferase-like glycosyltransferase
MKLKESTKHMILFVFIAMLTIIISVTAVHDYNNGKYAWFVLAVIIILLNGSSLRGCYRNWKTSKRNESEL